MNTQALQVFGRNVATAREDGFQCLTPLERQFALEFVVTGSTLKAMAEQFEMPLRDITRMYNDPVVRAFISDLQAEVLQHKLINEQWVETQIMQIWPKLIGEEAVPMVDKSGAAFNAKKFHSTEVTSILEHFGGNNDQKKAGGVMVQVNFGAMGVQPPEVVLKMPNSIVQPPNDWTARQHQREFMDYMFKAGEFPTRKRAMPVWHRRAGKDSVAMNTLAVASQMRVGTYWHLLPTLNQGRKVVWNGVDGRGRRMIYQGFPREMIGNVNESDMLLKLQNDSVYQVVGSDNYDALVGTNPLGVVFSEWALADPNAWSFIRPILAENGGFAIFITTPRGKNHAHKMYQMAVDSPDWYTSLKTIRDTVREDGTPIITEEIVEQERLEGVPDEVIQQEYYCSWEGINHGSIFGRQLLKYQETNQLEFEADLSMLTFTAWDIGRRDATAIWFYQIVRDEIHIVDYTEGTGGDVDFWLEKLHEFPYLLGTPALPHDAKARTFATKYSPHERFVQAKFTPYIVPSISVAQGISAARAIIPHIYFNVGNPNVRLGLGHLTEYCYDYDEKTKTFALTPRHDYHSHAADAFRMLALSQNVIEVTSRKKRETKPKGPQYIYTPIGRAMNLENLFRDREARNNLRRV